MESKELLGEVAFGAATEHTMKKESAIAWVASAGAIENARTELPKRAKQFFSSGRKATGGRVKIKRLHEFRLEVKRFRYTLELFQPLYGPALEEKLAKLRRAQQLLGAVNDCATTRALVLSTRDRKSLLVAKLMARLDEQERSRTRKFLAYWKETFDPPGEQKRWLRYLKAFAGRGGRISESPAADREDSSAASEIQPEALDQSPEA